MKISKKLRTLGKLLALSYAVMPVAQATTNTETNDGSTPERITLTPQTNNTIQPAKPISSADIQIADIPNPFDTTITPENLPQMETLQSEETAAIEFDEEAIAQALATAEENRVAGGRALKREMTFHFVAAQESNEYTLTPSGQVQLDPITTFYFCSGGALTIGYGTMIPFDKTGTVAKEGVDLLDKLVIQDTQDNNRPLTLDEKIQLAVDLRAAWRSAGSPTDWLHTAYVMEKYQKRGKGMDKFSRYVATAESCETAMRFEAADKLDRMDALVKQTIFTQTMATDGAYRRGLGGMRRSTEYSHLKDNVITTADANNTSNIARNRAREGLMREHDFVKAHSFNMDDPIEQRMAKLRVLGTYAVALAVQHYEKEIQRHNPDAPLKVLLIAQLATVQLAENACGHELCEADIREVRDYTTNLVYDGFFAARRMEHLPQAMQEDIILLTAQTVISDAQKTLLGLRDRKASPLAQSIEFQRRDPILHNLETLQYEFADRLTAIADTKGRRGKPHIALPTTQGLAAPVYAARSFGIHLDEAGTFKPAGTEAPVQAKPAQAKPSKKKASRTKHKSGKTHHKRHGKGR